MAFEFHLPDIGEGLTEAEVLEWLVAEGEEVALDQPLVQIETDKAVTEIPSPRAGRLLRRGVEAGAMVRVGEVLAVIAEPGDDEAPAAGEPAVSDSARFPSVSDSEAAPIVGSLPGMETLLPGTPGQALPAVRRRARELGVNLAGMGGSGPGGRVTMEDVEAALTPLTPSDSPPDERVRLSALRRSIAAHMERSWREIPHVTAFGEADATRLLEGRRAAAAARVDRPFPMEVLFIRAVLPALRAHPEFNASFQGTEVVLKRRYDIGVAVDTPDGLLVGVVRGADRLDDDGLADEVVRLAGAIRARTATPMELSGQTFTVSNIGAVRGGYGTPIIPFGTTAILSFGRIEDRPAVREGKVVISPMLPLSLSYDHRAIDGALGRRFLSAVVENLE